MLRLFWGVVLVIFLPLTGPSQDVGIPYIKNFSPETYSAEPQNWQICQRQDGVMVIANNSGVLEFDGVSWKLIPTSKTIARSVAVADNGVVYVGSVGDLGYIKQNANGAEEFVSLLDKIPEEYHDFVDVWRTSTTQDGVYFKTNRYIFLWDGTRMTVWSAPKFFAFSFVIGNDFYVKEDSLGLICFRNKRLVTLPLGAFFKGKEIRSIIDFKSNSLLISTLQHGMFIYTDQGKVEPYKTTIDDFLKKNLLFASVKLDETHIAFGTFRGGLVIMDNEGRTKKILNENSGIIDNSIRAMFLDREGSLWLALNNGICRIELHSPISIFDKRSGVKGSVYQVNRHKGIIYIGTSVGLNYLDPKTGKIVPLENFSDQVWSLTSLGDQQLLGTNSSTYALKDFKLKLIDNSGGSLKFLQSHIDSNRVFVGERDGLQSMYYANGMWKIENRFENIKGQVKNIVEDRAGNIWVQSNQQGVACLHFIPGLRKTEIDFFSKKRGMPSSDRYKLTVINDTISIFSGQKFYFYDASAKEFNEAGIKVFGEGISTAKLSDLADAGRHLFLAWSNASVGQLKKINNKSYQWDALLFRRIRDKAINFAYADGDSLVWIGSANGLYRINVKQVPHQFNEFETRIRTVSQIETDSVVFSGANNENDPLVLDYTFNQLRFQYSLVFFDQSDETEYQTFLEGVDEGWSGWSTNVKKDYTNLSEGSYVFRVKSRNIYYAVGKEARFSFVIRPPWFRTVGAYLFYVIMIATAFFAGVRIYFNGLNRANKRLEMLVKQRTTKINLQKEEIESQRDNLALAHNTIEKQNNELVRMNHELEKIVEERTSALTQSNVELVEVNRELDRFVYRAAHDLRGPLATLLGLCNLSLIETSDKTAIDYLTKIRLTAEKLNFLLFMLLKINRIKTKEIICETIDINAVVNDTLTKLLASNHKKSTFKISTKIDRGIQLFSDRSLMSIILENLIDNSIKFSRADITPEIDIEITKESGRLKIIVRDNGIGIHEDYRDKIFEMFFIGTAEGKGLGLGLHAVQMAVKKLKGTVCLVQSDFLSTQFLVDIPERL